MLYQRSKENDLWFRSRIFIKPKVSNIWAWHRKFEMESTAGCVSIFGRWYDVRRREVAAADEERVRLETSPSTKGFYVRFGFRPVRVTPDGDGPGLDRWDMVLRPEDHPLRCG